MAESRDVSRRRFLKGAVAAAAAPPLLAIAQAEAATAKKKKALPAARPAESAAPKGPDYSVAKTPDERTALEKQYKQLIDTLESLRKVPVAAGAEFATGAIAPARLRRGEA